MNNKARLAQSVERETFNLKAKGSSPLSGGFFFEITSFNKFNTTSLVFFFISVLCLTDDIR